MIPKKVFVNKNLIENGKPYNGVQIFEDRLEVHPDHKDKAIEGLILMFGDVFEFVEDDDVA